MAKDNMDVESRLSAVETSVIAITRAVESINEGQNQIRRDIQHGSTALRQEMHAELSKRGTNFGVLGTWAGVILGFVLAVGSTVRNGDLQAWNQAIGNVTANVNGNRQIIHEIEDRERERLRNEIALAQDRGTQREKVSSLEFSVNKLDVDLQREMRLVSGQVQTGLEGLDKRLQGEIKAVDDSSQKRKSEMVDKAQSNESKIDVLIPKVAHLEEQVNTLKDYGAAVDQLRANDPRKGETK